MAAYRPFRCPDRYLFDPITRLCQVTFSPLRFWLLTLNFQREAKVECKANLFYSLSSRLAITLREDQLESFFSTPLTLTTTKTKTTTIETRHRSNINAFPSNQFSPLALTSSNHPHFSTQPSLNPWLFSSRSWFHHGK